MGGRQALTSRNEVSCHQNVSGDCSPHMKASYQDENPNQARVARMKKLIAPAAMHRFLTFTFPGTKLSPSGEQ